MKHLVPIFFLASFLAMATVAHAKPSRKMAAQAKSIYAEAVKDMDLGDELLKAGKMDRALASYAEGCSKFEAVLNLVPEDVDVGVELGQCYEVSGKLATALAKYNTVKKWALEQSLVEDVSDIESRITQLVPRVPRLRVLVPDSVSQLPGLTILSGGKPILAPQWGKPIPVNPSTYDIDVSALHRDHWTRRVEVSEGQTIDVEIPSVWGADDATSGTPKTSRLKVAGYSMLGVGGAALVGWGIVGGLMLSKGAASNADSHCTTTNKCDGIGTALRLEAQQLGKVATWLLIPGGALALTGIVLVAVAPKPGQAQTGPHASLWLGPGSIGVRGRW